MNTKLRTRTLGLAALALTASMGLAACGATTPTPPPTTPPPRRPPRRTRPRWSRGARRGAGGRRPVRSRLRRRPHLGEGSVDGMADDPVATAASNNPLLKTLVAAVTEAGLVDTLNSAEDLTVFAPTDDAFAEIPKKDLNALLADKEALTAVLTHHVIGERLAPDDRGRRARDPGRRHAHRRGRG